MPTLQRVLVRKPSSKVATTDKKQRATLTGILQGRQLSTDNGSGHSKICAGISCEDELPMPMVQQDQDDRAPSPTCSDGTENQAISNSRPDLKRKVTGDDIHDESNPHKKYRDKQAKQEGAVANKLQPTSNMIQQQMKAQLEKERNTQFVQMVLQHASNCRKITCVSTKCAKMKEHLNHANMCRVKAKGGCNVCKKVWALLKRHAILCKHQNCAVPNCRIIRTRFSQLHASTNAKEKVYRDGEVAKHDEEVITKTKVMAIPKEGMFHKPTSNRAKKAAATKQEIYQKKALASYMNFWQQQQHTFKEEDKKNDAIVEEHKEIAESSSVCPFTYHELFQSDL